MAYGAYDKFVFDAAVGDASLATGINVNCTVLDLTFIKTMVEPVTVTRFGFRPTTLFNYGTNPTEGVLSIYRFPTYHNGASTLPTDAVLLATIGLEDAAVVNGVYYVDVPNPVVEATKVAGVITVRGRNKADINAGEQIAVKVSTAPVGGTKAGVFQVFVCYHPRAEVADNMALMFDRTP